MALCIGNNKKSSKEVQQWNRGRNEGTCNRRGEHGNFAQGNVILTWTSGAFYWGIYTQSNNKLLQGQIHFWASQFKATVQDKGLIAEAFPLGNSCWGTHKSRSWNSCLKGQNNGLKQFGACPASMAMMVDRRFLDMHTSLSRLFWKTKGKCIDKVAPI